MLYLVAYWFMLALAVGLVLGPVLHADGDEEGLSGERVDQVSNAQGLVIGTTPLLGRRRPITTRSRCAVHRGGAGRACRRRCRP
jgi:hypothetical protein